MTTDDFHKRYEGLWAAMRREDNAHTPRYRAVLVDALTLVSDLLAAQVRYDEAFNLAIKQKDREIADLLAGAQTTNMVGAGMVCHQCGKPAANFNMETKRGSCLEHGPQFVASAGAGQSQPVAWILRRHDSLGRELMPLWQYGGEPNDGPWVPLYASPLPSAAPPAKEKT